MTDLSNYYIKALIKKPVIWRHTKNIPHYTIPSEMRDFLFDPGSTTKRMQREYAAQTKVKLLTQQWLYPHYHEAQLLNISLRRCTLIREVYLSCQEKIWMYARAVFPKYFFTGSNTRFEYEFDQRPLGKLLFRNSATVQRSGYELALLKPGHLEYEWATQHQTNFTTKQAQVPGGNSIRGVARRGVLYHLRQANDRVPQRQDPATPDLYSGTRSASSHLWARRSIIQLHQKPLLLTEIFFPEFLQLKKTNSCGSN